MLKRLTICVIFLLIAILSFSQNSYPKKILFGKDTLVLITPEQVMRANEMGYKIDYYIQQDSINSSYISELEKISKEKDNTVEHITKINTELLNSLSNCNNDIKSLQEQLKKEQKKTKRNLFITIGITTLTAITIGLIK